MIFIHGSVPSSKNSKQLVRTGGFTRMIWSKRALKYVEETEQEWIDNKEAFLTMIRQSTPPYTIGFHFVRNTKHKYDFVNPLQTVQDLMVRYEWLEDDNTTILIPFPLKVNDVYTSYSKETPGVYINLIN